MMANLARPGDNHGYYNVDIYDVMDQFESKGAAWMQDKDYFCLIRELMNIKFTVQVERDRVPGIIKNFSVDFPFDENRRFRDGRWLAITDGLQYLSRMVNASYFKNRADEVNRGRGNITNVPSNTDASGSDGSRLQEDFQAPQDLRDATTQFSKALQDFQRATKESYFIVRFENRFNLTWTGTHDEAKRPAGSGAGTVAQGTRILPVGPPPGGPAVVTTTSTPAGTTTTATGLPGAGTNIPGGG